MPPDTADLISHLRSADTDICNAAYDSLCRNISALKSDIYRAAKREEDPSALSSLVELLGESKDPKYMVYIAKQLRSEHAKVRFGAYAALLRLGTPESVARHMRRDVNGVIHPLRISSQ